MVLVDSSVWINHLRRADGRLVEALRSDLVLTHPFVTGELALGSLKNRVRFVELLRALPTTKIAENEEVLEMIEGPTLFSHGLGWIDAHLLVFVLITGGATLWTADERLDGVAKELGIGAL